MWYTIFIFTVVSIFTYLFKQSYDNGPNKLKFYFYFFVYYSYVNVVLFIMIPYFLLSPKNVRNAKVACRVLKFVTKFLDIKWQLRDGNILSEDRGAVIVANHQSTLDVLGMFNIWEVVNKLTAIGKKELFYVWPFGICAYLMGIVFIDRKNAKEAYKQLKAASELMIKDKIKIWIFPEGTRNKDQTKLMPFKKGAFNIAIMAQVPIIPVVFSPYHFVNKEKHIFNKGNMIIQCLEPISTVGLTMDDIPSLIEQVHDKMTIAYKNLCKEVVIATSAD